VPQATIPDRVTCTVRRIDAPLNSTVQNQQHKYEWILLAVFLLTLPLANPWVRGDGVGYYAYARAPLIEHNLDFTHDYQSANEGFRETRCDENGQPKPQYRTITGHLDNHFSVGPAILWAPFLISAHGLVLLARTFGSQVAADGFSAPYRYTMALGTGIYGFLGLLLSFRLARRFVEPLWAFMATLAMWWASSLPVYMYFNPSWSHAHSAFIVAVFLCYWESTRENRTLSQWLTLGLISGLMLDVYYPNLFLLTILAVEAVGQYRRSFRATSTERANFQGRLLRYVVFAAAAFVVMIPTFISRWIVYGGPLRSGYISIRNYLWSEPVFFSVLFSSNHGLLAWTPVVALAVLGLVLFAIRVPDIGVPFFVSLVAFYVFISFYPDWAGISSFGNRFFTSLTALFVLGLAYLLQGFAARFREIRWPAVVSAGALACFVLWNLGMIYQWGTHLVPARGPISFREAAYNQFFVVPRRMSSQVRSYLFRRSDLMREIEQGDIEQQKSGQP
jgi:hypothetical protein